MMPCVRYIVLLLFCYKTRGIRSNDTAFHLLQRTKRTHNRRATTQLRLAYSGGKTKSPQQVLQTCETPLQVLNRVGRHVQVDGHDDSSAARVSSLVLVRLCKMLVSKSNAMPLHSDNILQNSDGLWGSDVNESDMDTVVSTLGVVCNCLAQSISNRDTNIKQLDVGIEGIKAASVLSRLLAFPSGPHWRDHHVKNLQECVGVLADSYKSVSADSMQAHQLSGLQWAFDSLNVAFDNISGGSPSDKAFALPQHLQDAYDSLELPFRVRPSFMKNVVDSTDGALTMTVQNIEKQVLFQADDIRTTGTNQVVTERRQTAWEGVDEDTIPGFAYSGKTMTTRPFSPIVKHISSILQQQTNIQYDGCLLNLYPDGGSGMRYHIDPDQGVLWDYETAVVSVGASRRFAFRCIPCIQNTGKSLQKQHQEQPHNFWVLHGDVTEMFGNCQSTFQHTVKTAESKTERAPRISMVYKKSIL
jgi:alkylated DNA repair dioxygenase AlkB